MAEVAEALESPDEDEDERSPDERLVAIQKRLQALNNEVAAVRRQLWSQEQTTLKALAEFVKR